MALNKKRPFIELTTKLGDIPREWLERVEPHIVRMGSCWIWQGACDGDGEPTFNYPQPNGKRTSRRLKRWIVDMFWDGLKPHHDVLHHCGDLSCINPAHFFISAAHWKQEDRAKMIEKKRKAVKNWNEKGH